MQSLDTLYEDIPIGETAPPIPKRHKSSDAILGAPPLVSARRHYSIAQTDHKHVLEEVPAFYDELKMQFDRKQHVVESRPDSPPLVRSHTSVEELESTLADQTLDTLFGDTDLRPSASKRRVTGQTSEGAKQWMQTLEKRKAAPVTAMAGPSGATPPDGWTPTLKVAMATIKLKKTLSRASIGRIGAADGAAAAPAAHGDEPAMAMGVTAEDLQALSDPNFDVNSFIAECWMTHLVSNQEEMLALFQGAYDEPVHAMAGARGVLPAPPAPYFAAPPNEMTMPAAPYYASPPVAPSALAEYVLADTNAPYAPVPPSSYGQQYAWAAVPPSQPQMSAAWGAWPAPMSAAPMPMAPTPAAPALPRGSLGVLARQQEGSRLLQQALFAMPSHELAGAVAELAPHLRALATDAFGNWLVSEMVKLPEAHAAVHAALRGQLCMLMQHPQGSRVCQNALQHLPPALGAHLVGELEGRVAEVAGGTHGSWSVVEAHKHTCAPFIVRELAADLPRLSALQNGSRAVQRVLVHAGARGEDLGAPLDRLLGLGAAGLAALAHDKFGNYVVQIALDQAPRAQRRALVALLLPAFRSLALDKFGSNVAEKLVELASAAQLAGVCEGLGVAGVDALRAHAYGSYVVNALDGRRAACAA